MQLGTVARFSSLDRMLESDSIRSLPGLTSRIFPNSNPGAETIKGSQALIQSLVLRAREIGIPKSLSTQRVSLWRLQTTVMESRSLERTWSPGFRMLPPNPKLPQ